MVFPSRTGLSVSEAYSVLGLERGADIAEVKKAYKSHALQSHPDYVARKMGVHLDQVPAEVKAEATAKFQKIGESYEVLTTHLEDPRKNAFDPDDELYGRRPGGFGRGPSSFRDFFTGGGSYGSSGGRYYDDDDDIDEDDIYDDMFDDEEEERAQDFADFLYYMFLRTHGRQPPSAARAQYEARRRETPAQQAARKAQEKIREEEADRLWRVTRERERKQQAEQAKVDKERKEREKQEEAEAATIRRKAKAEAKKASWQAARAKAAVERKETIERRQSTRSKVFVAARRGDFGAVKLGIGNDATVATGGEIFHDEAEYDVKSKPKDWDKKETLMHIAVEKNNLEFVSWLCGNGGDPEERDSAHLTAFNRALRLGRVDIVKYFLEEYPLDDPNSTLVLAAYEGHSNLLHAVHSGNHEVVTLVFKTGLIEIPEVEPAWRWMDGQEGALKAGGKFDAIRTVLKMVEGWTPPPSPSIGTQFGTPKSGATTAVDQDVESNGKSYEKPKKHRKHRHQSVIQVPKFSDTMSPPITPVSAVSNSKSGQQHGNNTPVGASSEGASSNSRGAGQGRGAGRGRGRGGRGKGGGKPNL